jgi:hypothetical protein
VTAIRIIALGVLFSFLTGCATFKRTENLSSSIYQDPSVASLAVKPIGEVTYGHFVNFDISEDLSPSLSRLGGGKNLFEVIEVDGKKGQPFHFVVSSICDCIGFSKTAVLPVGIMFDKTGGLIAKSVAEPNPMLSEMKGTFPYTGPFRLLVIADAKHEGEKIGDANGFLPGTIPFSVPIKISVDGKVQVEWLRNSS